MLASRALLHDGGAQPASFIASPHSHTVATVEPSVSDLGGQGMDEPLGDDRRAMAQEWRAESSADSAGSRGMGCGVRRETDVT